MTISHPSQKVAREKHKTTAGWYHSSTTNEFGCIFYAESVSHAQHVDNGGSSWGPFPTFTAAKEDALAYFRCDVNAARNAIREIRATKKPKKRSPP